MLSTCLRRSSFRLFSRSFSSRTPQLDPLVADLIADSNVSTSPAPNNATPKEPSNLHLPSEDRWRKIFPLTNMVSHRVSLKNRDSAYAVADAFVPHGSKDKVIVEAYPGPGQLTRALLNLPRERIRKIIILEDDQNYLAYLRPLEDADPRVKVLPMGGYDWSTYLLIDEMKLLNDVPNVAWTDGVHPSLQFISHLPSNVVGDQLVAQFLRSIPDQQWLFKYGRVPMSFVLSDHVWKRMTADFGTRERCKLTVIAEAAAECSFAVPSKSLQPYDSHFHPSRTPIPGALDNRGLNTIRLSKPMQAVNFVPLEQQAIRKGDLDVWDFCLRRLFVQKATPLKRALATLAPGAQLLVEKVTDPKLPLSERIDAKTLIYSLSVHDWKLVVKAFNEWPFAPKQLAIFDSFTQKEPWA